MKNKTFIIVKIVLTAALCTLATALHGQDEQNGLHGRQEQHDSPFSLGASYVGDLYDAARGGLRTGAGFMGMGHLCVGLDTGKAGWWRGGELFVDGATIHGKSLSGEFLGDLQVASNIDAGTHTYLSELWFRQRLGAVAVTLGLQDLNADFIASDNAGEFINSSFGVPPVISGNVPVPIFPITGLGASAQWDIDERFTIRGALFDGSQQTFEHNPHNLHWKFSREDGVLAISELQLSAGCGTYKAGVYYHSGYMEFDEATKSSSYVFEHNYGFYLLADHTLAEFSGRRLDAFGQFAAAPRSMNAANMYTGLGLNLHGAFTDDSRSDVLGLAVASVHLHSAEHKHETTIELHYKYNIGGHLSIQPDIQYIFNPSGADSAPCLPNALVGILRVCVEF